MPANIGGIFPSWLMPKIILKSARKTIIESAQGVD